MKVLFVWPNKDSFGFKPVGISLLSSIARESGWETCLFDTTEIDFGFKDNTRSGEEANIFKPVDLSVYGQIKKQLDLKQSFLTTLRTYKPDCIAVSVLNDELLIASKLSSIAKEYDKNIPIIWGGKYPTIKPEKTLSNNCVDFVCIGEGLEAFKDFLSGLKGKGDLYAIPNIWAKQNGKIKKNAIRPLKKSLDDLPYLDWEIFDKKQFYKPFDGKVYLSGDHMLNWGCPYHCTYCINHFYHNLYDNKYVMRRYSEKRIVMELKYLVNKYSLEFFKFHDEDFLMRPLSSLEKLSELYKQEVNVPFVIETNPNTVTKEKAALLKKMNCVSASLAIENGDFELRKKVLKRTDSEEDIINAFNYLKDLGIRTSAFIMLGLPFETRKTYKKSIQLSKKANVQYPCPGFFYPFEGTELRDIAIDNDFYSPEIEEELQIYQRDMPVLKFKEFSTEELIEMRNVFVLYVKLPDCFTSYIERSEKNDLLGIQLRKKLIEIYEKTVQSNDGWYCGEHLEKQYLDELEKIVLTAK